MSNEKVMRVFYHITIKSHPIKLLQKTPLIMYHCFSKASYLHEKSQINVFNYLLKFINKQ